MILAGAGLPERFLEGEENDDFMLWVRGASTAMCAMKGTFQPSGIHGENRSMLAWIRAFVVSCEHGGALAETAVVLPLVLLLMTGIFSFSTALYQKLELAQAIGAGGRFLAVDRGDTDPCATTASKIYAAAPSLNQLKISLTFVLNGTSYPGATCSGTTNMVSGGTAKVTATYPCSFAVYGKNFGACSISESASEVVQ
jgi:Flp pilus assembly protein TadG